MHGEELVVFQPVYPAAWERVEKSNIVLKELSRKATQKSPPLVQRSVQLRNLLSMTHCRNSATVIHNSETMSKARAV